MRIVQIVFSFLILSSLQVFAGDLVVNAVSEYKAETLQRQVFAFKNNLTPVCAPNSPSCIEVACDLLGRLACDDVSEIEGVAKSCAGNFNGLCLKEVCSHLKPFGCDAEKEISRVTLACKGNEDGDCVREVCARLSPIECDDHSELERVASLCRGN